MKLGFIGAGNMAGALIAGTIKSGVLQAGDVHIFDLNADRMAQLNAELGVQAHDSCAGMIGASDILVLAVKPNVASRVLGEQRGALKGKALISVAAGWTSEMLASALDEDTRRLRVMPNTPALVSEGMTALSLSHTLTDSEKEFAERVFLSLGRMCWVREDQMEAVTGVSGSGPAYAYLFVEALADAGVYLGLTREQATLMAAQTLKGAAEMVLKTGRHPGELKDMVCSPGGTTIVGVKALEDKGLRAAVMGAAVAAAEKAAQMRNA